jgi:hypothetical protein
MIPLYGKNTTISHRICMIFHTANISVR